MALTVSSGPSNVRVPVVAGQTQNQASNTLGTDGLNVGTSIPQSSTQYPANTVIGSDPPGGPR